MKTALFYYCLCLIIILTVGAAVSVGQSSMIPLLVILPILLYFLHRILGITSWWTGLLLYYSFIVVTIMAAAGLVAAKTIPQAVSTALFLPLAFYFFLEVLPKRKHAVPARVVVTKIKKLPKTHTVAPLPSLDIDRRKFLKLVSTAGLSFFIFSLFTKKAEAAFFGSVPGPGTVSLKDTTGAQVDPAITHPTDGYKIAQLDDSSPAYYGYLEKTGKWFIMKEDASGNYRYTKGTSGFSTNWTNRASLSYDYYDAVF